MISLAPFSGPCPPALAVPDWNALQLLLRRFAAMLYDGLLLVAVLFFASLPVNLAVGGAIHDGMVIYQLYLLAVTFAYLGWQWTRGGQTLGMKAWRLRLVNESMQDVNWRQSLLRFAAALLSWAACGLGYLWLLIDRDRLAWHDRLSRTRLILTEARP